MQFRNLVLPAALILCLSLLAQNSSLKRTTSITVNVGNVVKPVQVKFGTGVGSLHRGPGWPPVDLTNPVLLDLFNEVKPAFINLANTMSPNSVANVIGFPFYRESTGDLWWRETLHI